MLSGLSVVWVHMVVLSDVLIAMYVRCVCSVDAASSKTLSCAVFLAHMKSMKTILNITKGCYPFKITF